MTALLLALLAGYGVFLAWTGTAMGWRGVGPGPDNRGTSAIGLRAATLARSRPSLPGWLAQAGLGGVRPVELAAVCGALFVVGCALAWTLFGGVVAALAVGGATAAWPVNAARRRRQRRLETAREAWPRMIEELRVLTGAAGRSVPQALLDVGLRGPVELRPAFEAAQREWQLTTDFERTIAVLKAELADPTADVTCETLLVAHEVGGTDLDRRLAALVDDRIQDVQGRKDARARQAGVRFARRFVLLVPAGMALCGLTIGDGHAAYRSPAGQAGIAVAAALLAGCWLWSGRMLRLPDEDRVFS